MNLSLARKSSPANIAFCFYLSLPFTKLISYYPIFLRQIALFFFHFRSFYVSVRDASDTVPELHCGEKSRFSILGPKLRIEYRSTRYSSNWPGFQASYVVLNESIVDGKAKQFVYCSKTFPRNWMTQRA